MTSKYQKIPAQQSLVWSTLQAFSTTDEPVKISEIVTHFKKHFPNADELFLITYEKRPDVSIFRDRISRSCRTAERAGLLHRPSRGTYTLTAKGKNLLALPRNLAEEEIYQSIRTSNQTVDVEEQQNSLDQDSRVTEIPTSVNQLGHLDVDAMVTNLIGHTGTDLKTTVSGAVSDLAKLSNINLAPNVPDMAETQARLAELTGVIGACDKHWDSNFAGAYSAIGDTNSVIAQAAQMASELTGSTKFDAMTAGLTEMNEALHRSWNITMPSSPLDAVEKALVSPSFRESAARFLEDISDPTTDNEDVSIADEADSLEPLDSRYPREFDDIRNLSKRDKIEFTTVLVSYLRENYDFLVRALQGVAIGKTVFDFTASTVIFLLMTWLIAEGIKERRSKEQE